MIQLSYIQVHTSSANAASATSLFNLDVLVANTGEIRLSLRLSFDQQQECSPPGALSQLLTKRNRKIPTLQTNLQRVSVCLDLGKILRGVKYDLTYLRFSDKFSRFEISIEI